MNRQPQLSVQWGDMVKLEKALRNVETIPKRLVTKAAGKGATVVRKSVRGTVPVLTGDLKRGIIRVGERSRDKGKKVYQLTFNSSMNDVFQKPIKNPGVAGGKRDHGYYPASMEYGFLTRSKGGGLSYVPGYYFMRAAADASRAAAQRTTVQTLTRELEKEWKK